MEANFGGGYERLPPVPRPPLLPAPACRRLSGTGHKAYIAVLATNFRLSDIGIARWRGTMLAFLWHRRKRSEETIDGQADQSLRRTVGAGSGDLL
jgi:hypothetical protein